MQRHLRHLGVPLPRVDPNKEDVSYTPSAQNKLKFLNRKMPSLFPHTGHLLNSFTKYLYFNFDIFAEVYVLGWGITVRVSDVTASARARAPKLWHGRGRLTRNRTTTVVQQSSALFFTHGTSAKRKVIWGTTWNSTGRDNCIQNILAMLNAGV